MPARQAFVIDMVDDRKDLSNAIALNSLMVNASRVLGPSIGGALIAAVGEGWCFAVDALSYVAVIASLLAMPAIARAPHGAADSALAQIRSGWDYVRASVPIRTCLGLVAVGSVMGMPYAVLMPAMADRHLGGGAHLLGLLMTATGVGALVGSLYLASRETVVGLGRVILTGTVLFGLGLIGFSQTRHALLASAMLTMVGAGFVVQMAASNTLIQTILDERFRGRVMSFYSMAIVGTIPIGSLLAGVLADRVGTPTTILLGGVVVLASAAWFARMLPSVRAVVRPLYIERGIIALPGADLGADPLVQ